MSHSSKGWLSKKDYPRLIAQQKAVEKEERRKKRLLAAERKRKKQLELEKQKKIPKRSLNPVPEKFKTKEWIKEWEETRDPPLEVLRSGPPKVQLTKSGRRKRMTSDERARLTGYACDCCLPYYNALQLSPKSRQERIQRSSRHRALHPPIIYGDDFWNPVIPASKPDEEVGNGYGDFLKGKSLESGGDKQHTCLTEKRSGSIVARPPQGSEDDMFDGMEFPADDYKLPFIIFKSAAKGERKNPPTNIVARPEESPADDMFDEMETFPPDDYRPPFVMCKSGHKTEAKSSIKGDLKKAESFDYEGNALSETQPPLEFTIMNAYAKRSGSIVARQPQGGDDDMFDGMEFPADDYKLPFIIFKSAAKGERKNPPTNIVARPEESPADDMFDEMETFPPDDYRPPFVMSKSGHKTEAKSSIKGDLKKAESFDYEGNALSETQPPLEFTIMNAYAKSPVQPQTMALPANNNCSTPDLWYEAEGTEFSRQEWTDEWNDRIAETFEESMTY